MQRVSDQVWREKKTVGNIAENIVRFLIESTPGWECIPYGMENHIGELKKLLKNNNTEEISRRIRSMPDFIAVNKKTNKVLLIDVKYRSFVDKREPRTALYGFNYGQIKDYLDFWKATYLVIVHKFEPYFNVVNISDIEWHKHFYSRTKTKDDKRLFEQWNFKGIQKSIKYLLPELPDEALKKAVSMIPKNNP